MAWLEQLLWNEMSPKEYTVLLWILLAKLCLCRVKCQVRTTIVTLLALLCRYTLWNMVIIRMCYRTRSFWFDSKFVIRLGSDVFYIKPHQNNDTDYAVPYNRSYNRSRRDHLHNHCRHRVRLLMFFSQCCDSPLIKAKNRSLVCCTFNNQQFSN